MPEPLVLIHRAGETISLVRGDEHSFSVFGGPPELSVGGIELPQPLHLIALLNHNQVPYLGAPLYIWEVPLLYGMRYSGCTLTYSFARNEATVEAVSPSEASADWPYTHFPELLPTYPLVVAAVVAEGWAAFSRNAPNLPLEQPSDMVALVPPPVGLGFTLWGRGGDAEGVTLVFECDLSAKRVTAYNVCS